MTWQAIHEWLHQNSENNLFGVIVGATIGFVASVMVPIFGWVSGWWSKSSQFKARKIALAVELDYLRETIIQIKGDMKIGVCLKRLNTDFLAACRLDWFESDGDEDFIKALAKAYRDVVHTNDRLDGIKTFSVNDFMGSGKPIANQLKEAQNIFVETHSLALNSAKTTEGTVKDLRSMLKVKTKTTFPDLETTPETQPKQSTENKPGATMESYNPWKAIADLCDEKKINPVGLIQYLFKSLYSFDVGNTAKGFAKSATNQANVGDEISNIMHLLGQKDVPPNMCAALELFVKLQVWMDKGKLNNAKEKNLADRIAGLENDLRYGEPLLDLLGRLKNELEKYGLASRLIMEKMASEQNTKLDDTENEGKKGDEPEK